MPTDSLSNIALILTAYAIALIVALWAGIIVWVWRDIKSRTRDFFIRVMSVMLVIVLFIPGILIYWIIRPRKTIEEKYQNALEEEALLNELEKKTNCPGCGRMIENDWIICPSCHTRIKKLCINCGKPLDLQWTICPSCGVQQQKANTSTNERY